MEKENHPTDNPPQTTPLRKYTQCCHEINFRYGFSEEVIPPSEERGFKRHRMECETMVDAMQANKVSTDGGSKECVTQCVFFLKRIQ